MRRNYSYFIYILWKVISYKYYVAYRHSKTNHKGMVILCNCSEFSSHLKSCNRAHYFWLVRIVFVAEFTFGQVKSPLLTNSKFDISVYMYSIWPFPRPRCTEFGVAVVYVSFHVHREFISCIEMKQSCKSHKH